MKDIALSYLSSVLQNETLSAVGDNVLLDILESNNHQWGHVQSFCSVSDDTMWLLNSLFLLEPVCALTKV